ncbi:ISAzo13-like element transposase-related protein [Streptomyces tendae]
MSTHSVDDLGQGVADQRRANRGRGAAASFTGRKGETAIPYGVYDHDLIADAGGASIGDDHETFPFAVATISRRWQVRPALVRGPGTCGWAEIQRTNTRKY